MSAERGAAAGTAGLAQVEALLKCEILPAEAAFLPDVVVDDEARCDVRKALLTAGDLALRTAVNLADPEEPLARTISWLRSQTKIANNLHRAGFGLQASVTSEAADGDARDRFQGRIMAGMYEHAQTLPKSYLETMESGNAELRLKDNLLVIAPTGVGKTVMLARFLRAAGVGTKDTQGLVVVPGQELQRQFKGDTGDDTFRRWLGPEADIAAYWQHDKQTEGALKLVTKQSLEKAIAQKAFAAGDIGVAVVDEGHVGLEPKLMHLMNNFARVYYFTATPAYGVDRDLRKMFRHIDVGTITDCIYEGIVNDAELYSFYAADQEEAQAFAAGLAYEDAKNGRRVLVYCRPGEKAKQAEAVAAMVNAAHVQGGADDGTTLAARLSTYEANNNDILARFEDGELSVLTTVNMLSQGYNGNINTIIVIGPNASALQLAQRIGRGLRLNAQYRTRIIEINVPHSEETVTIWGAFGLDDVQQGQVLEPKTDALRLEFEGSRIAEPPLLEALPERLRAALVPNQSVRQMTLGRQAFERAVALEEGFIAASALAAYYSSPLSHVQRVLDDEGFRSIGIWAPYKDDTANYDRWYEPAAEAYLDENPPASLWQEGEKTLTDLMKMHDVSKDMMALLLTKLELEPEPRIGKNRRETGYYSPASVAAVGEAIAAIPQALATDVTVGTMRQELGEKFVVQCLKDKERYEPEYKRRFAGHGIKGFDLHFTDEQVVMMRLAFEEALATDADISYKEIAELAGVNDSTVLRARTQEERDMETLKRAHRLARPGGHLPREKGLEIVERLRVRPLPVHFATLRMAELRTEAKPTTIAAAIKRRLKQPDHGIEFINLGGTNAASTCMPWAMLRELEERYGLRSGVEPIDYAQVATSDGEALTHEQWQYSTAVQRQYYDDKKISLEPALMWTPVEAASRQLRCTFRALAALIVLADKASRENMQRKPDGSVLIGAQLLRQLHILRARPYSVDIDWTPHDDLLTKAGLSEDEIKAAQTSGMVPATYRRLGLNDRGELDICYSVPAVREMRRSSNRARRQGMRAEHGDFE